jgi:hypothetical protein
MLNVNGYLDTNDGQYCITIYRFVEDLRMFSMTIDLSPSELCAVIATLQEIQAKNATEKESAYGTQSA